VGQLIWTLTIMRETKGFPLEQHRRKLLIVQAAKSVSRPGQSRPRRS
jgi:hypothetical protein